jgi:hypothetical protein
MDASAEKVQSIPGGPTSYSSASYLYSHDNNAQVVSFPKTERLNLEAFQSENSARSESSLYHVMPQPAQAGQPWINPALQDVPTPRQVNDQYENHAAWNAPPDPYAHFNQQQAGAGVWENDFEKLIAQTRAKMIAEVVEHQGTKQNLMYGKVRGKDLQLPAYEKGRHCPTLALINPRSGAKVGKDILAVARFSPVHQDRFFDIIKTVQDQSRGGLMDVFRIELCNVKEEARQMGTRPRIISGGGDGTGSFTIHMVLQALQANNARAMDGLGDTGNGFIWTDDEMRAFFPALAQMPLGSANDFANILGWGQKFPGSVSGCTSACSWCSVRCNKRTKAYRFQALCWWIEHLLDPHIRVQRFDVWGIMPTPGTDSVNFKLCELAAAPGRNPKIKADKKWQLGMKEAGRPTPFFILLYFSAGFGGYLISRFQNNRRSTPFRNRLEYIRQAIGMVCERVPPQMFLRANGIKIECVNPSSHEGDEAHAYFPPRSGRSTRQCCGRKPKGSRYREVGFYNINWQAHSLHGADRGSLMRRTCFNKNRKPIKFNDGLLDMYRMRFKSAFKNPGLWMQTDKKKDMLLTFQAAPGKGLFFQYDGEGRFAFSPTGEAFKIYIRKVLTVPVVVGPKAEERLTGSFNNVPDAVFEMHGDTPEQKELVRLRILKSLRGDLDKELNATKAEMQAAKLPLYEAPHDHVNMPPPAPKNPKKFHNDVKTMN